MNYLQEIQIGALFHDIGKFIRKSYSTQYNTKLKHTQLSEIFIEENKDLFNKYDIEIIKKLVLYHHGDIPATLSKEEKDLINILKISDGFSAANDRRLENFSNKESGRSEYSPIYSIIPKIIDDNYKYALTIPTISNMGYKIKEFNFDNDSKDTMLQFDENHIDNLDNLYKNFIIEIKNLYNKEFDFDTLNDLLEKYLIYINPNTWHLPNSKLGNTTTSLYDHTKTTSAIAGCLYRHYIETGIKPNNDRSNISFFHISLNQDYEYPKEISLYNIILKELKKIGLHKTCIISNLENDLYFIYPNSDISNLIKSLQDYNLNVFNSYGLTINYEYIENWNFKKNLDFMKEFELYAIKFVGIKEVIFNNIKNVNSINYIDDTKNKICLKNQFIVAFKINNYEDMLNTLLENNNSISNFTTFVRTYEYFQNEVKQSLKKYNYKILKINSSSLFFVCDIDKIFTIEREILEIYERYVDTTTGLTFSYIEYNRYNDCIDILNDDIIKIYNSKTNKDMNNKYNSFTRFGNGSLEITSNTLSGIDKTIKKYANFNNNAIKYKILNIYEKIIIGFSIKDISSLSYVSKLYYLTSKAKNEEEEKFIIHFYNILETCLNKNNNIDILTTNISQIKKHYEMLKLSINTKGN